MKKIGIVTIILVTTIVFSPDLKSQANWEVGVRGFDLWSVEATIPIGTAPRFHPAVYFDRFGVGGYFDWMFALSGGPTGLKFFPGVGPEFWFGNDFDFYRKFGLKKEHMSRIKRFKGIGNHSAHNIVDLPTKSKLLGYKKDANDVIILLMHLLTRVEGIQGAKGKHGKRRK